MSESISSLAEQLCAGNRRALARAITLIESTRADDRDKALQLLEMVIPYSGKSVRLGISGVPGVGKSTFIEAIGNKIIDQGHRLAVLTIDPSSSISGGSILGDKTRMDTLARRNNAFIRPSPAGSSLGGVTRHCRETVILCEAAGFDLIMIETVGVGQSETKVSNMTDMFLLLLLPGAGDEIQGMKRGIVELADLILINKADNETLAMAKRAQSDYRSALRLLNSNPDSDWQVDILTCSSREGTGLTEVWDTIQAFTALRKKSGKFAQKRAKQGLDWMWNEVNDSLIESLLENSSVCHEIPNIESAVKSGDLPPTLAAQKLLMTFLKK